MRLIATFICLFISITCYSQAINLTLPSGEERIYQIELINYLYLDSNGDTRFLYGADTKTTETVQNSLDQIVASSNFAIYKAEYLNGATNNVDQIAFNFDYISRIYERPDGTALVRMEDLGYQITTTTLYSDIAAALIIANSDSGNQILVSTDNTLSITPDDSLNYTINSNIPIISDSILANPDFVTGITSAILCEDGFVDTLDQKHVSVDEIIIVEEYEGIVALAVNASCEISPTDYTYRINFPFLIDTLTSSQEFIDSLLANPNFSTSADIAQLRDSVRVNIDSLVAHNDRLVALENQSLDDADADPNNEIQALSKAGSTISLSIGGGSVNDDDTQLNEAEVDAFVANNGYLTGEVDGDSSNEIQNITWNPGVGGNDQIGLDQGGGTITINDDNTQLNEGEVDAFVANNGYLSVEIDGDTLNEIQSISSSDGILYLSGDSTGVDLDSIGNGLFSASNNEGDILVATVHQQPPSFLWEIGARRLEFRSKPTPEEEDFVSMRFDHNTKAYEITAQESSSVLRQGYLALSSDALNIFMAQDYVGSYLQMTDQEFRLSNNNNFFELSDTKNSLVINKGQADESGFYLDTNNDNIEFRTQNSITRDITNEVLTGLTWDATTKRAITDFADVNDLLVSNEAQQRVGLSNAIIEANQDLSLSGDSLLISNGIGVDLSSITLETDAIALSALNDTSIAIRNDFPIDTKLSEAEVGAFVADDIESAAQEAFISISNDTVFFTNNVRDSEVKLPSQDLIADGLELKLSGSSVGIDVGYDLQIEDPTNSGNPQLINTVMSNVYSSINPQLTESEVDAFVANNGYLTSQLWSSSGSDAYYNTGNVGIGTATPSELLELRKTSFAGREVLMKMGISDAGVSSFGIGNFTSTSGVFIPQFYGYNATDGRVGLSFLGALSNGNDLIGSGAGSFVGVVDFQTVRIPNSSTDVLNATRTALANKRNSFSFRNSALNYLMSITPGGFVGIGTNNATARLDVTSGNNSSSVFRVEDSGKITTPQYDGTFNHLTSLTDNHIVTITDKTTGDKKTVSNSFFKPLNGAGAPTVSPRYIGDTYLDTTNENVYYCFSDGGNGFDSTDWVQIN